MSEDLTQTVRALEARVKRLEATEAIRKLIQLYAYHCDNGYDDDAWSQLFTSDGTATMASDDPDLDDAVVLMGAYRGTAIQTGGTWKFSEVSATFKHMSNLDQGWVRQPFRATEIGRAER